MMFVKTAVFIPVGAEIFISYAYWRTPSLEERRRDLKNSGYSFSCECGLCQFEKDNTDISVPAIKIARKVLDKYQTLQSLDTESVSELQNARTDLYKLFRYPIPERQLSDIKPFASATGPTFALARLQILVLERLGAALHLQCGIQQAVHIYAESFAIVKGNLGLSQGMIFDAPDPAIKVHLFLSRMQHAHSKLWLDEAVTIWSLMSGEKRKKAESRISKYIESDWKEVNRVSAVLRGASWEHGV
jgi:hypothetical protein